MNLGHAAGAQFVPNLPVPGVVAGDGRPEHRPLLPAVLQTPCEFNVAAFDEVAIFFVLGNAISRHCLLHLTMGLRAHRLMAASVHSFSVSVAKHSAEVCGRASVDAGNGKRDTS